ncbi:MAG: hypothetical protein ACRD0V_17910, partial [Acidimicrobiales bacterium]
MGGELCRVWSDEVDRWLADLLDAALGSERPAGVEHGPPTGLALAACGGYGRRELSLQSDVDVVLLHSGRQGDVGAVADRIW